MGGVGAGVEAGVEVGAVAGAVCFLNFTSFRNSLMDFLTGGAGAGVEGAAGGADMASSVLPDENNRGE